MISQYYCYVTYLVIFSRSITEKKFNAFFAKNGYSGTGPNYHFMIFDF